MDELIAKRLSGEITDVERQQLERWLRSRPENQRALREAERVWGTLGRIRDPEGDGALPRVEAVIAEAEARRRRAGARARASGLMRSSGVRWGLAAASVAGAIFVGVSLRGRGTPSLPSGADANAAAGVTTLSLADGTVVRLAGGSRLDLPSDVAGREVFLEGKAFFAVAPAAETFVVHAGAGDVTVHGTRFEVLGEADSLRVVVVEGSVRVGGAGGSADLEAGAVAHLTRGRPPRIAAGQDVWALLEWPAGLLVFQGTPLSDVGAEVSRHFGRPVEVAADLADLRITAWFEDESLDEVVAAVCLIAGSTCEVTGTGVTIGPKVSR